MATTGTPLNLPLMSDSERTPHITYNAAMAILNAGGGVNEALSSEESITTTATMDATDYGVMHVITGTTSDYTINLPTPVTADLGKIMGFRVANSATKVFTLDAAGAETIDGATTYQLRKDDVVYLKAVSTTGNTWQVLSTKFGMAWASWTPTWTNLTVGSGVVTARYALIGKVVMCRISFVFGAGSAVSGDVQFSLPLTRAAYGGTASVTPMGESAFFDTSASAVMGGCVVNFSTTTASPRVYTAGGTYISPVVLSAIVPFTWATGDEFLASFFYEAA